MHRIGEIGGRGQLLGRAEQHGGMAVLAGGMHLARHLRGIVQPDLLLDEERVHVGTQGVDPPTGVPALQDADDADAAQAAADLDPQCGQPGGDQVRGAALFKGGFGMAVDVLAQRGQTVDEIGLGAQGVRRDRGHVRSLRRLFHRPRKAARAMGDTGIVLFRDISGRLEPTWEVQCLYAESGGLSDRLSQVEQSVVSIRRDEQEDLRMMGTAALSGAVKAQAAADRPQHAIRREPRPRDQPVQSWTRYRWPRSIRRRCGCSSCLAHPGLGQTATQLDPRAERPRPGLRGHYAPGLRPARPDHADRASGRRVRADDNPACQDD